jgi:hypothetical protein
MFQHNKYHINNKIKADSNRDDLMKKYERFFKNILVTNVAEPHQYDAAVAYIRWLQPLL